jgi:hypothetical protein
MTGWMDGKNFMITTSFTICSNIVWTPCLMHRCVCIWQYILQNYNYKLHFQNLSIYHIARFFLGEFILIVSTWNLFFLHILTLFVQRYGLNRQIFKKNLNSPNTYKAQIFLSVLFTFIYMVYSLVWLNPLCGITNHKNWKKANTV